MPDPKAQKLDEEILELIRTTSEKPYPDRSFEQLAFQIFDYQFKMNQHYRKFCLIENKTPKALSSWKDIPAMPTVGFKELVLTTFPPKRAVKVFRTSGTTQGEIRGAHFFDTLKLYEAAILAPFKQYFLSDNSKGSYFFLVHSPQNAPDSSLSHMMGVINGKFAKRKGKFYALQKTVGPAGCGVPHLSSPNVLIGDQVDSRFSAGGGPAFGGRGNDKIGAGGRTRGFWETLASGLERSTSKAFILATAFSLKSFLDYLEAKKITLRLKTGSRLMETGGFKGRMKEISKSRLYAQCERWLGVPKKFCVSEYGMTELSSQFYDTVAGVSTERRIFHGPAWVRTLVIDPETGLEAKKGETGMLRHFDLANRGSVMAIQTEDLGRAVRDGFELVGRAEGSELRGCSLTYEEFLQS